MAHRSGKHRGRYDDPYTFDDPYIHSPPTAHNPPAYEYIGTDEPLSPGFESPSRHAVPSGRERARRHARTISPPRHSRHDGAYTPPPHTSRHSTSPRPKDRTRERPRDSKSQPKGKHFYQDFAEHNPKLQRLGKKSMTWLGEAAATYAAAQAGKNVAKDSPRSHSVDRSDRHDRSSRHHRRYASSPSRSPSPPRRRHTTRYDNRDRDRERDHEHGRRRGYSASPPPLSRDPDSYLASRHGSSRDRDRPRDRDPDRDRSRGRRHHHHRPSPSPSRSPSRYSRRTRPRSGTAPPTNPAADRWQMAARAALEAGGLTAFRLRKEPGSWTGGKAAKIATAALGAAAMDAFMDQDPRAAKGGMKGMAENAITSMLASQIMGKGSKRKGR
ncbi:hypothetical protein GGS24DRAFT_163546 [Hypoxylon argillaceum]|nr:hypothetical protein GGS24DRAFT_163546 [Hypoxylon argillaceum]KAI1149494.1 hypothetical protein F4825DRAFT_49977 [Nemania diffusa]